MLFFNMKKQLLLWVAVMAMTMNLNARVVLINEGFENGISEDVWTQECVAGQMLWAVENEGDGLSYPATVHEGSQRAYLRNPGSETLGYKTRLISKVMDLRPTKVTEPQLSFWYANPKWGADRDTLRVLYRTGSREAWKVLEEFSTAAADWTHAKLNLSELGQYYQIAFEGTDNLGHGIVLDEIKVQGKAECTIPYDIMVTNKGAGKVNVSWQASWDADSYELIVTKDTIDPDMIAEIEELTPEKVVYHGEVTELNQDLILESGEFYLVYVRSLCEDEISAWSSEASKNGPFGFRVRVAKQIPFTENFNYASGVRRDPDWSWGSNTGKTNPFVNSTTTGKARANYSPDTTAAVIFSGGAFDQLTTVIPADRYAYMATPAISDSLNNDFAINQCQVHFWSTVYTNTGRKFGRSLIVGVMEDPDDITTFTPVDTVTVWGNMTFVENIVDLSSYHGTGVFLAFASDFDRDNLFYIDNLTVEYRKAVNKVTKISVNPRDTYATISWEGNANSYNVLITNAEVDPSNPSAAAVVDQANVNGNSYVCEALEADHSWNAPYYVYVQAEGQEWSYRYPFVTVASQREIPYGFDFEATTTPTYQIGTKKYVKGIGVFGNSGNYPALENNSQKSYVGSGCMYMSMMGGKDGWITLPMVEDLHNTQIKFYLSGYQTYDQAHATVGVMTNPMDINTFVPVADFQLNTTGYTRCYANFENYTGPDGVIAIVWADVMNMSKFTNNYIDELVVEELSDCVPPTNIELPMIAPDSITVTWEASSLSDEWELFVSRIAIKESDRVHKSFEQMQALPGVEVARSLSWSNPQTNPLFGIGGLNPHTNYYIYVRATCDPDWWTELAFSTPCRDEEFPYKETFEGYTSGSTAAGCWQLADYLGVDYPRIYMVGSSSNGNKTLELFSSGTIHRSVAILPTIEGNMSDMLLSFDVRTYAGTSSSTGVIYVGTMSDIHDQSTFVPFDTLQVSGTSFQKARFVLSNYNLAHDNLAITSGLGTLQMNSDVLIDNVELKDPSCIDAYDIKQLNPAPHSIDIVWNGSSDNDEWVVKVLSTSVAIASVKNDTYNHAYDIISDTLVTGKAFHLEDLEAMKTFYIYVRTLCGDSVWSMIQTHTTCELFDPNVSNIETFESYSDNSVPGCWTVGSTSSNTTNIPHISTHGGTKIMYIYQSSCTSWAATPEIKCDSLSILMVSFSSGASTSSEYCVLGVMTDPEDIRTFVALDSVKGEGSSAQLVDKSFELSNYASLIPAGAKYLAWRGRPGKSDWVYLDNVSIISLACPIPKTTISDLSTNSVRINSGLTVGDQWTLLLTDHKLSDQQLEGKAEISDTWIIRRDTTDKANVKVTNLKGQTRYYVYTAALCEDSTKSPWKSFYFTTPCEALNPETMGVITFAEEDGFVDGEIPCWTVGNKTEGASSSYIPYVGSDGSIMHNSNHYLQFYDNVTSSASYVGAYAIMPNLDIDSINKYQVNFWGRGKSSYNSQIIVGVISDPTDLSTFMPVDTLNLSKTAWDPFSVGFEKYEGDFMGDWGKNIMFITDFGASNYAYISEVSVELIPHCRAVSSFDVDSVGENSAVISWKGYQDTYRLLLADKVLTDDQKPNYRYLLDTIVDHSDGIRLTGLEAAANYYVYVQGICEGGDSTAISMTYAYIRTTCPTVGGAAVPFYDDFESYELDDKSPGCWQLLCTGTHSTWFAVKTVSSNGTKAIDVYSTSSNGCYMVVPKVNANLENLKLTFDARSYGGSSAAKMYVGVMSDVNDVSTFVQLEVFELAGTTAFTHCTMDLSAYELPYDNLVITAGIPDVTATQHDAWLDNVGLELLASCNSPKLVSAGATATSVNLTINPVVRTDSLWELVVIPADEYEEMSAVALAQYLKDAEKISVDSTRVTIQGLEPATSYYIFARTICSDEDVSAWTRNPLKVTTRFYYANSYYFGFEKAGEDWARSKYSESDAYYLHPALETGRVDDGQTVESMQYYPYAMAGTDKELYSRNGDGAMLMYSDAGITGSYVIFPSIGEASDRSFEFKVRPSAIDATTKLPKTFFKGVFEIGTIDKDGSFDSYESLATIRMDKLSPTTKATTKASNNMLFTNFNMDVDSVMMANKQLVFYLPQQVSDTTYLFFDDVRLDAPKGFSLVALKKVVAEGTTALVEWSSVGGEWNLKISKENGIQVAQYDNLSGVTSQLVEGLEPNTSYIATLELANIPASAQYYRTSDKLTFRTLCEALEPNAPDAFVWDFNNADEWERNDILGGDAYDELYFQPACFQTGITYLHASNGYQWLIQQKGYETNGAMTTYNASRNHEAGIDDSPSLRVHTTANNYNSYLVLPKLQCGLDTMMIEFYGRCFANYDQNYATVSNRGKIVDATYLGSAYSQSLVVGTLSDPKDLSTLHVIDTVHYSHTQLTANDNVNGDPAGLRYWELMQLPLDSAKGDYIVLFQPAPGLFYLDNLTVKPIGNTLFKPTNTKTTNVTATTATTEWNVYQPQYASVIVLLNGEGEEIFRDTIIGTQYQLTNLNGASIYQWYVYQTDGTNDSPATKPLSFATDCITNTPAYTCGFEDEEGWKNIEGQNNYKQTLCWTYGDAAQGEWKSATYDPYNQANSRDYAYSFEGTSALVMRASFSSRVSYQPYIAMPAMDVNAYDTLQVMFWMRPAYVSASTDSVITSYTGSTYSKSIIVGTMTDPTDAATFMPLDTVTYDGTLSIADKATAANNWLYQQMKVELVGATGPYVAFMTSSQAKGGGAQKTGDYVWIDNISFEHKQECKDPTDLEALQVGTHHAVLRWNGIDAAGSYILQVSTDPYFVEEEAFVFNGEVESNTYRVEGLSQLTTYVWRVQAICDERWGESSFSQKATFSTSRSPYFYEPFEAAVSANEWTFSKAHMDNVLDTTGVVASGLDSWSFSRTTNGYGLKGSHYQAIGYSADYHWMITPILYLPEEDSVHFSVDLALTACNTAHAVTNNAVTDNDMKDDYYFMIIISEDGGKSWKSSNILDKWQNTNPSGKQLRDIPTTGMKVRYSLAPYAGKNVRIAFYREARSTANTGIAMHVDNVRFAYFKKNIDYASACQYEDITVDGIHLSGDETTPGIHAYPTCFYASDAEALAGKLDSVQQLEIEVFAAQETFFADTICEGESYIEHDFLPKTTTGVYRRKLHTIEHGCDSIVTLNLYVKERRYAEQEVAEICPGEPYEWNGETYNRAGIYRDTIPSSIGCDSVLTLILRNKTSDMDTIYVESIITPDELPFTYEDPQHPYVYGQAPISYPEGTPIGTYMDTAMVESADCADLLIHTLIIRWEQGLDELFDGMGNTRKLIYRDQLYIICNDEWYNSLGQKVADPRK